ncbi:MAG: tetratricopeptide repeat protein [Chitinivibrionales bacterium]|nr:tetratricopeptide repeat protein [Chitinivibrionales bacterium]
MRKLCLICGLLGVVVLTVPLSADEVYTRNKQAKRLYEQGKYDEALEVYNEALLAAPDEPALHANRGSVLFRTERYDDAVEAYDRALDGDTSGMAADVHYNRGNAYFRQGEQLMAAGNQQAMEKFKAALTEYVQVLKLRPSDKEAKWNLELAAARVQQSQQPQNQGGAPRNMEPSEYAKEMKRKADELVARTEYREALALMQQALTKDKTVQVYREYMKRLGEVSGVVLEGSRSDAAL